MTYTVHLVFSWSWWAFGAGVGAGTVIGFVAAWLGIAKSLEYSGFNP
jgi:hypothetical protein